MSWTKEEYKFIELMKDAAIDTTTYKVYCEFCDAATDEQEYPSQAAEEAWNMGFRPEVIDGDDTYVMCQKCREKGIPEDD